AGAITPAPFPVSSTCTRVAVMEGHTEAVHVELARAASAEEIAATWRAFGADLKKPSLPSAPPPLIHVHEDPFRPQPRLERDPNDGMPTAVGRLRADDSTPNGWKYVLVSHNTKMGAAKGTILVGEQLVAAGLIAAGK